MDISNVAITDVFFCQQTTDVTICLYVYCVVYLVTKQLGLKGLCLQKK